MKSLIKKLLKEGLYDSNVDKLFNGQSKVRTRVIFAKPNPHGTSYNSDFNAKVNSVEDKINNLSNADKQQVNLKDIAPTQRFISLNNLDKVKGFGKDTNATLILIGDTYYAIDGHHRITSRILSGKIYNQ